MSQNQKPLFDEDLINEVEKLNVSDATNEQLMGVLWYRSSRDLNIALHKGIEKLYRMCKGERIHPTTSHRNRGGRFNNQRNK